jgi:hypothetical protein
MFFEKPSIDGTPKCARDEIKIKRAPAEIAGFTRGRVIFQIAWL